MEIMYHSEPSTLETSLLGNENQDPLLSGRVPGILWDSSSLLLKLYLGYAWKWKRWYLMLVLQREK